MTQLSPDLVRRYRLADEVWPHAERDAPTVGTGGERLTAAIDGVLHERLRPHADHRGILTEVVNFAHPFWDEPIVHAYCFTVRPGRIKGWGLHRKQADRYFLTAGRARVILHDGRVHSPTFGAFAQFHLSDEAPALLLIPPGVWHADQNTGDCDAVFLNFPTRPFDPVDPDKYRIDPHAGTIPFDWTLRDG
jgi:dTDP-4-dehydrorhamnose 3,5-epimerase